MHDCNCSDPLQVALLREQVVYEHLALAPLVGAHDATTVELDGPDLDEGIASIDQALCLITGVTKLAQRIGGGVRAALDEEEDVRSGFASPHRALAPVSLLTHLQHELALCGGRAGRA